MIKAIETIYNGYRFRSRLEARWAVAFDELDIKWEYEKEGFDLGDVGYYLPDFWLPDLKYWIEIKGRQLSSDEACKLYSLGSQSENPVLALGNIPNGADDNPVHYSRDSMFTTPAIIPLARWRNMLSRVSDTGWGLEVCCPICGDDYVHISTTEVKQDKDDYSAWDGRGGAVCISMWCESGHHWELRFGFHKGNTYLGIENAREETSNFLAYMFKSDELENAYAAARQARFEHGQVGAPSNW